MVNKLFIDTGAFFACFYDRDQHHAASLDIWSRLELEVITAVTTNHVVDELATLLARRTSYEFSAMKVREIYKSETIIERPSENDELMSLKYFEKYADQKISFTDCLSFVVMQKLEIKRVFTFDRHFEYAGFEVIDSTRKL